MIVVCTALGGGWRWFERDAPRTPPRFFPATFRKGTGAGSLIKAGGDFFKSKKRKFDPPQIEQMAEESSKRKGRHPLAREFARGFYKSKAWKKTRKAYFESVHGLCERCRERGVVKAGEIVHHKQHLEPRNINDPSVTLSFTNLELLCRDCHAAEHPEIYGEVIEQRVAFDENGNLVRRGSDAIR